MKAITTLAIVLIPAFGAAATIAAHAAGEEVTVTVNGETWDADSRGFAYINGLSVAEGTEKAARRGARISVDGQPDKFAVSGTGGTFALEFRTREPVFRLIVDGDRFPRTITQPYAVPEGGGEVDVGRVNSPRAEGEEHTWPLPMVAEALGYASAFQMLADNKAVIRLLVLGSGADGAPDFTDEALISFPRSAATTRAPVATATSPFLMRIPQSEYVIPFDMNKRDTFFQFNSPNTGAFIIVVSFEPGDDADKDVVIQISDPVSNELLDPPRPWTFSPKTISVRNGFATDVRYEPDI